MDDARWPELRSFRPGVIPLGPLTFAEILLAALDSVRRYAAVLFSTSLVVVLLSQVAAYVMTSPMRASLAQLPAEPTPEQVNALVVEASTMTALAAGIGLLGQLILTAIATVVISRAVLGTPIGTGTAVAELRSRMLPLCLLGAIVATAVMLGMLFFVIPGIWLFVLLSLAVPALILERTTVGHALQRSRELIRGAWWRSAGVLGAAIALTVGVQGLISLVFSAFGGGAATAATGDSLLSIATVGTIAGAALTAPFAACVVALLYIDRRMRTENLAIELARSAGMAPPDAGEPGVRHPW